ncbi:hypothetical protein [Helicobacter ganmani]|uniref:hypothetical protein n=1 Tax=Helicobacter ganmani TaxID=60246 RepID=UPI003A88E3CC
MQQARFYIINLQNKAMGVLARKFETFIAIYNIIYKKYGIANKKCFLGKALRNVCLLTSTMKFLILFK